MIRASAVVAVWLAASAAAAAPPQTVYRCGPDGRVYSQTPCADGKPVTTEDSRSTAQQKAARDAAARDARRADELADERRQRAAAAARHDAAVGIKPTSPEAPASAPKKKTKGQAKPDPADSNMSPPMRVPTRAPRSK
jgi:hypothetical protein